jgi:hypothetical protein
MWARAITPTSCHGFCVRTQSEFLGLSFCGGHRRRTLETQRLALIAQRQELAQQNRLRERVQGFTDKVKATINQLNFDQR